MELAPNPHYSGGSQSCWGSACYIVSYNCFLRVYCIGLVASTCQVIS